MEEMTRQELRRAPTTFLKATESRFLSSLESSTPVSVTDFMEAAMSSYLRQDMAGQKGDIKVLG